MRATGLHQLRNFNLTRLPMNPLPLTKTVCRALRNRCKHSRWPLKWRVLVFWKQ